MRLPPPEWDVLTYGSIQYFALVLFSVGCVVDVLDGAMRPPPPDRVVLTYGSIQYFALVFLRVGCVVDVSVRSYAIVICQRKSMSIRRRWYQILKSFRNHCYCRMINQSVSCFSYSLQIFSLPSGPRPKQPPPPTKVSLTGQPLCMETDFPHLGEDHEVVL